MAIAVLDSGIKWNDLGAMDDLRRRSASTAASSEQPLHDRAEAAEPGADCAAYARRLGRERRRRLQPARLRLRRARRTRRPRSATGRRDGRPLLDPQDVLIAFTDGDDDDGNGFVDDIVGWDFLDDDNDPFDDVQYGHGTGEARDSTAEADNGGDARHVPELHVDPAAGGRLVHRRRQPTSRRRSLYATDNDVRVVQEALGALNNSSLARDAVEYAYRHGVAVIASAADEAAQHHNWPSNLAAHDRRQLGHASTTRRSRRAALLPPVQRLHELLVEDHRRDPERELLLGRHRPRGRAWPASIYSAALNATTPALDPHPPCSASTASRAR